MVVHVAPPDPTASEPSPSASKGRPELEPVKGAFLASLNHEIRTPLSGVMGMLDLLAETDLDDDQRDYVAAARLCTESLAELLNATLEYTALEAGQVVLDESEFSLREALEAAVNHQQSKADLKRLKLTLSMDPNLPVTMVGDGPRIRELLSQLLANAIKFTHTGSVEVRASVSEGAEGQKLVLAVRDTGIGIPPDRIDTIFESFRQGEEGLSRGYPGLGLGLALVRKLAAAMGGKVSVESEPGAGSTFTAELPVRRAAESLPTASGGRPVILVVEDNAIGLRVLRHMLERRSLRMIGASSGREALEAIQREHVDLVLMDLHMPEMNGLETAAGIRSLPGYRTVPILALTANCSDQVKEQCLAHGMQAFLSKPIDAQELWSAVSRYLSAGR
jgi:CheY-like chemotaxis protein/two-component sensor histidine kinase